MGKYLYQVIKEYLTDLIKANKDEANFKLPSENQLALKFSTTRITAKRALTELQEEGYIYRVHGKGSFIKSGISSDAKLKDYDFICMLLPNLDSKFISNLVNGAQEYLKTYGFHLIILSEKEDELIQYNLISRIVNLGVKGIIVFPNSRARYNKDLLLLALNKFPVVFVDRTLHNFDVTSVTSDHTDISRKGVQLLIDKGCKNIGFISKPAEDSSSIARRIIGYEKAHVENGLRIIPDNMLYINKNDRNQFNMIHDYLKENYKLDGLLTYGDQIGFNVYRAIARLNIKIPDQLKIIFFDDEYSDFFDILPFSPTAISQRGAEIGQTAAELIIRYITKKTLANNKILINCDIIERQSTGGNFNL